MERGDGRPVSIGRRLTDLAATRPDEVAVVAVARDGSEATLTWARLEARANRVARRLADEGIDADAMMAVALPNGADHLVVTLAAWKLGACVLPLDRRLPPRERAAIFDQAPVQLVVGRWETPDEGSAPASTRVLDVSAAVADDSAVDDRPVEVLPDRVPDPGRAVASGGSTGTPKVIVDLHPLAAAPGSFSDAFGDALGLAPDQVQLVAGPLHHNLAAGWVLVGIFEGHRIVLMEAFDAALAVDLIEQHGVQFAMVVPTMMKRILAVDGLRPERLRSLRSVVHTAGPCAPALKRAWIELLGPDRVFEAYGATEGVGMCTIDGATWLEHPGSVGRPLRSEVVVLGEDGAPLAPGEVGELFMRPHGILPTTASAGLPFRYLGDAVPQATADGFVSVGDLGWVDADGFVHLADRRSDMIVSGGSNVYPAEVEAALFEHPGIADAVVVGLPDEEWGGRVHAVVVPAPGVVLDPADLDAHCRVRLARHKVPKSFEVAAELPRNEAGKLRRAAIRAERVARAEAPA